MYVVATCGVFVVGVKFTVIGVALNDIASVFAKKCQHVFSLRDDESYVKVENACDSDPIVTALSFMDKFTDAASKVIRKQMTTALKDSIAEVYTKMYEKEMQRKVQTVHEKLFG